ncbi:MAG: NUDIX domain-containing protein [Clostridia bacterium]|nr:NUDIX domain-containing protein [Clostridia bacterium]
MKRIEYYIFDSVYDDMTSGKKTVEFRLLNDKSNSIEIGDEILFKVYDNDKRNVLVEVVNKDIYDGLDDLWNNRDAYGNSLDYSKEEFENAFNTIFGKENVDNSKIVAINFKIKKVKLELFDVVDENRTLLGYTKERGAVLEDNEYNVGVEFWLFNDNKLLMTQRSLEKSHPGEWEVPGGCSQTGETSVGTLLREAKEEVNLSLIDGEYTLIGTELYKKQFVDMYLMTKKVSLSDIVLQEEEVSDCKFFTKEEFLKMAEENKVVKSVFNRYLSIKDKLEENW